LDNTTERVPPADAQAGPNGRTAIDALPNLLEAYKLVDKNKDGTFETFRLFKRPRRSSPTSTASITERRKISHLLEALPDHFTLMGRRGKSMLAR
jgi:hypothetical protein